MSSEAVSNLLFTVAVLCLCLNSFVIMAVSRKIERRIDFIESKLKDPDTLADDEENCS